MKKSFKKIFIFLFAISFIFIIGNTVLAQLDTGINSAAGIGLGNTDPRIIAANVIRVFLGFLGLIALLLILYAGFLWTTSAGDASKIDKAKKILVSAVIGLLIILSAFAIASFILSQILGATLPSPGPGPGPGPGPLPGPGPSGVSCDGNTLTAICDPDDTLCVTGTEYCDSSSCTCQLLGGFGAPCDFDTTNAPICDPDDTMCMDGLSCDGTTCLCGGAPIIDWISPVDNLGTPNGAIGDFVTIGGRFFGTTTGTVIFGGTDTDGDGNEFGDADDRVATFPNSVNPNCTDNWTEWQVIVVVPAGAVDGPIQLIRQVDLEDDVTNNSRGANIDNFLINTLNRPGLCLANPSFGYYEDSFTLQGISLTGTIQEVSFGNMLSSTSATNINTWTNTSVNAAVPNIGGGLNTVFATIDGTLSNALNFNVYTDLSNTPIIDHIDPNPGPPGQYATIFGNNFGISYLAPAEVSFTNQTNGNVYSADGLDFPLECQDSWWQNNYILIKIPPQIGVASDFGLYDVVVTNNSGFSSLPETFDVNNTTPGPGICEMIPHNGPVGFNVEIIGDNFTTSPGSISFYDGVNAPSIVSWVNQSIETVVPTGAQTGPVVVTTITPSNPFPFMVGQCSSDAECGGGEECCADGTYWDGICRNTGTCNDGAAITTTGYGWTFSSDGVVDTTTTTGLTCSGWSGGNACLVDGNSCPNSPGQCQTDPNPITGFCSDSYCESVPGCGSGNCEYDDTLNKCVATSAGAFQSTCEETSVTVYPGYDATCALVNSVSGQIGAWQIQTGGASCPTGTYLDTNGWCTVGSPITGPITCSLCDSGFSCTSGQCTMGTNVCSSGSTCNVSGFCEGSATCECCCEVAANDCCLGLTCVAGGCGDLSNPTVQANYGQCTGCRVESSPGVVDATASDLACNCTGTTGKFCYIDPLALVGDPLYDGVCLDIPITTPGGVGDPCDDPTIPNVGICDPDSTMCLPGLYCDPGDCTCQTEVTLPGAQCVQDVTIGLSSVFTCDPTFACGTGYGCRDDSGLVSIFSTNNLDECGICCCDPAGPDLVVDGKSLGCEPDKSPCDGVNRGLYCGCENDLECGSPDTVACGDDTCCRPRPQVVNTSPPDEPAAGSDNVCRNVLLEATFDTEMDTSTFRGNIVLLGDYGADPCPEGTQYLALNENTEQRSGNIFVKTFNNIKNKISSMIFGEASAYVAVPPTNNFCAIKGKTDGYNNVSGQGVLTFAPNRALDGNTRYYAIVIGDDVLNDDNPKGVLNRFGVSMGVNSTYPVETFNSVDYENSYIWSFVTMSDQGENQGICTIDYIGMNPASYLFQTTENSLVEDDSNSLANSFDTEKDSDKLFVATAKTISGQSLNPIAGLYTWAWGWTIDNTGVADFISLPTLPNNERLIRAQNTATEGSTIARAAATISGSLIPGGDWKEGISNIYLFLCNNPWPPIDGAGLWAPWQDHNNNCTTGLTGEGCNTNANYEFYYCRDQGENSTFDDLPPILDDAIIRGKDTDQNIFKEYYFFREETPDLSSTVLSATVPVVGSSIDLSWTPFTATLPEVLDHFNVNYGIVSGNYTDTISIPPGIYNANVDSLNNGQTYYFSVTAVYESGAESDFTNEVSAIPEDTQAPASPFIATTTPGSSQIELGWNPVADASSYKVYWKAGSGCGAATPPDCYGSSYNVGDATGAVINELTFGITYHFAVTAIDSSGNESPYSSEVVSSPLALIPASSKSLQLTQNNTSSSTRIQEEDRGMVAGAFEESTEGQVDKFESNRINLFGDIMKYIFKKLSYKVTNKAEAQGTSK